MTPYVILLLSLSFCGTTFGESRGENCKTSNLASGTCKLIPDCPALIWKIKNKFQYARCGFEGTNEVVCCPNDTTEKKEDRVNQSSTICSTESTQNKGNQARISQQKCREYADSYRLDYNEPETCLIGKEELRTRTINALPREFPHMALIGSGNASYILWLFSGSLISDQYVLTTAFNFKSALYSEPKYVLLGELDTTSERDGAKPERFGILTLIPYPGYRRPPLYNDIALIKLDKKVEFSPYIRPACLPTVFDEPEAKEMLLGWNHSDEGRIVEVLLRLKKKVVEKFSQEECNENYRQTVEEGNLPEGIRNQTQMCFGVRTNSKEVCISNAGSLLLIPHKDLHCMQTIIGITSLGLICNDVDSPEVYTRVYPYIDWIESIVWGIQ
ncbi:unnamed protein product [Hermetia illucens]|uniref:Uncharacterized protein n=1 Tax=Hermetia illucens TaxID=343691 RepID=A0A7R8V6B1_HERIL|nr:serine protease snake-like isoform X3 [Hermetia illucens]CAD7092802.1 unnamed protein product [Hermetia illucens]